MIKAKNLFSNHFRDNHLYLKKISLRIYSTTTITAVARSYYPCLTPTLGAWIVQMLLKKSISSQFDKINQFSLFYSDFFFKQTFYHQHLISRA